jgi:hypothetical protein
MSNTKKYKYMNGHLKMDPSLKKRIDKLYNQDPDRFREMIGAPQRKRKAKGGNDLGPISNKKPTIN